MYYMKMKDDIELKKDQNKGDEDYSTNYKMVIMVRDDLKMGRGKIAAQVGHAGII